MHWRFISKSKDIGIKIFKELSCKQISRIKDSIWQQSIWMFTFNKLIKLRFFFLNVAITDGGLDILLSFHLNVQRNLWRNWAWTGAKQLAKQIFCTKIRQDYIACNWMFAVCKNLNLWISDKENTILNGQYKKELEVDACKTAKFKNGL